MKRIITIEYWRMSVTFSTLKCRKTVAFNHGGALEKAKCTPKIARFECGLHWLGCSALLRQNEILQKKNTFLLWHGYVRIHLFIGSSSYMPSYIHVCINLCMCVCWYVLTYVPTYIRMCVLDV